MTKPYVFWMFALVDWLWFAFCVFCAAISADLIPALICAALAVYWFYRIGVQGCWPARHQAECFYLIGERNGCPLYWSHQGRYLVWQRGHTWEITGHIAENDIDIHA